MKNPHYGRVAQLKSQAVHPNNIPKVDLFGVNFDPIATQGIQGYLANKKRPPHKIPL